MADYDKLIDLDRLSAFKTKADAEYLGKDEAAARAAGILFGRCNSTSTATEFTATVAGLDALYDGAAVMLRNGVVTSASGFTINVNGLGAKPVYNNMATGNETTPTNPTRDTTIFNINYTMLLVYDSELVDGGAWICYRGYDGNTNTIGYQLRTNSGNRPMSDAAYRYRLYFTSADGSKWVPANTSTSTDATTARTLNTRAIDPFGPIVYNSTNGTTSSGGRPALGTLWQQYALTIGYSYVKTLTAWDSVWLKCQPNSDGSAVMKNIVQALPSSKDGYIYILLGMAYSTTAMELRSEHPVYWHDGTGIRIWTGAEYVADAGVTSFNGSTGDVTYTAPVTSVNGSTGAVTVSVPTKTSDLTNDSGFVTDAGVTSFNGSKGAITYTAPVTSVNGSTGAVTVSVPSASTTAPSMDGTASYGSGTDYARANHVHPTDTSRANANAIESATISNNAVSLWGLGGKTVLDAIEGAYSAANNKQAKLVSGTNIKTINNESLLGSGDVAVQPTLVSGTNIKTINGNSLLGSGDLTISGGGVTMSTTTCTLPTSGWSSDSITVSAMGVTASNNVIVAPAPASASAYASAGIVCTAQGSGTLTFTRTAANTAAITVNVMVLGGGVVLSDLTYTDNQGSCAIGFKATASTSAPLVTYAASGDTVYFCTNGALNGGVTAVRTDTQASVALTLEDGQELRAYSFTMPEAPVHVTIAKKGK